MIGKSVCLASQSDIEVVGGTDQLCASIKAGIEGGVHAMSDLFDSNFNSADV